MQTKPDPKQGLVLNPASKLGFDSTTIRTQVREQETGFVTHNPGPASYSQSKSTLASSIVDSRIQKFSKFSFNQEKSAHYLGMS